TINFIPPHAPSVNISSRHLDFARNTFELCPVDTTNFQNSNSRQKCSRAEGATLGLNSRQTQSPPRFSTRGKAHRLPIQII
ncbi:MAG: hypothetical protein ABL917_04010, partial [Parcubacteria group bacterium]